MTLDEVLQAKEAKRAEQRLQGAQQLTADMATEIERIKAEDWQAPPDVPYRPEQPAPMDWFIRGQIAKATRDGTLDPPAT